MPSVLAVTCSWSQTHCSALPHVVLFYEEGPGVVKFSPAEGDHLLRPGGSRVHGDVLADMVPVPEGVLHLEGVGQPHQVHQLPDVEEPVLLRMNSEQHVLGDDGGKFVAHKLWAVVPVAQPLDQLHLAVLQVGYNGPGFLLPSFLLAPALVWIVQLHPTDAIFKQPFLVKVLGDGDAAIVFSGHLPGKLAVRELLPEQDKLAGSCR